MTPLLGFSPDLDGTTPGVITDCTSLIPYETGMQGAPTPATPLNTPALADTCLGAAVVTKLDGSRRIFAGTDDKIYELSAGSWTDRSKVGGYTGGAETRWQFAQFGDVTIAANRADTLQYSTSAAFADISGAPKAKVLFTVGTFVMAANVNDGTEKPNGWHCSASDDYSDWTESVATLCASGQLVSAPGEIIAGGRLGEYAVLYKERAIYLGQFVGAPAVWDFLQVPGGDAGCIGRDAWCDVGGVHFIVGNDSFWIFDGTRPIPIGDKQVRQWFYNNSDPTYRYKTQCIFDRQNNRVWVFFVGNGSTSLNRALVYHLVSKQWGRADQQIESVLNYVTPGFTIDDLATLSATISGLPSIPYDSQYWIAGGRALSTFNTSHQLQLQNGACASATMTTGDAGDDTQFTTMTEIRLRYAPGSGPASAAVTMYFRDDLGDGLTTGESNIASSGSRFDVLQTAKWHRAAFAFTGDFKVTGIAPKVVAAGEV